MRALLKVGFQPQHCSLQQAVSAAGCGGSRSIYGKPVYRPEPTTITNGDYGPNGSGTAFFPPRASRYPTTEAIDSEHYYVIRYYVIRNKVLPV